MSEVEQLREEVVSMKSQLDRIELMMTRSIQPAPPPSAVAPVADLLTPEQAMALMKYTDRSSFMLAVRRDRIPVVKLNARCFRFDPAELNNWKLRKQQRKGRFAL
jgi:hypothetical protein